MGFIKTIRKVINPDYEYDDKMKSQIKKASKEEYYKSKEEEMKRFAKEKAKIETENKLKRLREGPTRMPGFFQSVEAVRGGLSSGFSGIVGLRPPVQQSQSFNRRGRHSRRKSRGKMRYAPSPVQPSQPQRYDVLGTRGGGWGI